MLGQTEWIIIGVLAILLFGAPKIIEWAKTLGKAQRVYKESKDGKEE